MCGADNTWCACRRSASPRFFGRAGEKSNKARAQMRRENESVCASLRAKRSNPVGGADSGLLRRFAPRNDDGACCLTPRRSRAKFRRVCSPRRGAGRSARHRRAVEHDRGAHAGNFAALGRRTRQFELHAAVDHLGIGKDLLEIVDRAGGHAGGFEFLQTARRAACATVSAQRCSTSSARWASRPSLSR